MKYNTICYLYITPVLKTNNVRHGYDYLIKRGYEVKIFDLSPCLNIIAYKNVTKDLLNEKSYNLTRFFSKKDIKFAIEQETNKTLFIPYFDFYQDVFFIFRTLSKNNFSFGYIHRVNSEVKVSNLKKERIVNYIKKISIHQIINSIFIRMPRKSLKLNMADFMVFGGLENNNYYKKINLCGDKTRYINIHALNYEDCINQDQIVESPKEPFAVFLDQYMPFHPDHLAENVKISPQIYYDELNLFFDTVKEVTKLDVVIAAHPKANNEINQKMFPKHKIVKMNTVSLIKNAELVIANFSTAISYATYYEKPVILCNSKVFHKYYWFKDRIKYWEKELNESSINLSIQNKKEWSNYIKRIRVDKKAYQNCVRDTMKANYDRNDKEKESFWKVFEKELLDQ